MGVVGPVGLGRRGSTLAFHRRNLGGGAGQLLRAFSGILDSGLFVSHRFTMRWWDAAFHAPLSRVPWRAQCGGCALARLEACDDLITAALATRSVLFVNVAPLVARRTAKHGESEEPLGLRPTAIWRPYLPRGRAGAIPDSAVSD
jgi:hypothetical protein